MRLDHINMSGTTQLPAGGPLGEITGAANRRDHGPRGAARGAKKKKKKKRGERAARRERAGKKAGRKIRGSRPPRKRQLRYDASSSSDSSDPEGSIDYAAAGRLPRERASRRQGLSHNSAAAAAHRPFDSAAQEKPALPQTTLSRGAAGRVQG